MPPARIVFWAATIGGIAFTVRSVLTAPPALPICIASAVAYFALLLSGVFVLRLRMFADVIVRGPSEATGVVLTFDDGPDPVHTREVLDALDVHEAKATFFVIGKKAELHRDVVEEILRRGHEVGVHGFDHDPDGRGNHDYHLDKGGERLDLAMAVVVVVIGWAVRDADGEERDYSSEQIDARVRGFGEHAERPRK